LDSVALSEIREGVLNVKVLKNGTKVIVIRRGDGVRVFHDICPHMGADLAEARYCVKTGTIHCKWHGYIFSVDDGKFLENPNTKLMSLIRVASEHYKPEKTPHYRLAMLPSSVKQGLIVIGRDGDRNAGHAQRGET
jgi:nitrite reductase (NADH) small subunit/3-phenylpropionate/trans-cinnamate dioxygenase ferredoxin subunit